MDIRTYLYKPSIEGLSITGVIMLDYDGYESGVVIHADPNEKVGLLQVCDESGHKTAEGICFSFEDAETVQMVGYFVLHPLQVEDLGPESYPVHGAELLFHRATGEDGVERVDGWTYVDEYRDCVNRVFVRGFRLVCCGTAHEEDVVLWNGSIAELLTDFPAGQNVDPLMGLVATHGCGAEHLQFQVFGDDDVADFPGGDGAHVLPRWEYCDDPRQLVSTRDVQYIQGAQSV